VTVEQVEKEEDTAAAGMVQESEKSEEPLEETTALTQEEVEEEAPEVYSDACEPEEDKEERVHDEDEDSAAVADEVGDAHVEAESPAACDSAGGCDDVAVDGLVAEAEQDTAERAAEHEPESEAEVAQAIEAEALTSGQLAAHEELGDEPEAEVPDAESKQQEAEVAPAAAVCLRRAGCTCVDCAEMAALCGSFAKKPAPADAEKACAEQGDANVASETEEHVAQVEEQQQVADEQEQQVEVLEESVVKTEETQPETAPEEPQEAPAESPEPLAHIATQQEVVKDLDVVPVIATAAAKPEMAPAAVCIRRAGCTCVDCAEMAAMLTSTRCAMSDAAAAAEHDEATTTIANDDSAGAESATEEAVGSSEVAVNAVEEENQAGLVEQGDVAQAVEEEACLHEPADETKNDTETAVQEESSTAAEAGGALPKAEDACTQDAAAKAEHDTSTDAENMDPQVEECAAVRITSSPPVKAAKAAPVAATGGVCIRRAGCTCADCATMANMVFSAPSPKPLEPKKRSIKPKLGKDASSHDPEKPKAVGKAGDCLVVEVKEAVPAKEACKAKPAEDLCCAVAQAPDDKVLDENAPGKADEEPCVCSEEVQVAAVHAEDDMVIPTLAKKGAQDEAVAVDMKCTRRAGCRFVCVCVCVCACVYVCEHLCVVKYV
jgi:hypothetical protein